MRVDLEPFVQWIARRFWAHGYAVEDLEQEARIAIWLATPGYERRAARLRILDLVKSANRKAQFATFHEEQHPGMPLEAHVELRETLRGIIEAPRTDNERAAVGRRLRGEPVRRSDVCLDSAFYRCKARMAA